MSSPPPRPPDLPGSVQSTEPPPGPIEFYGGYQVYSESGVDLTLLRENLKRSVAQLWEKNCRILPRFEQVAQADRQRSSLPNGTKSAMLEIEKVLRLLGTHRVETVVIGGLAMIAQGSAYLTEDMDFCYCRSPQNIATLADACASIHPYLRGAPLGLPFRFDAPTIQAGLNFTLTTDHGDIDFLGEVSGIGTYEKVLALSEEKEVYGLRVRVLSLDGLIAAKKAANRTKDKLHLLELEELKKMRQASG
jgi:predicted nucleotidyltransferase